MIQRTFRRPVWPPAAGRLYLAAAPTFALMAVLTGLDGSPAAMCGPAAHGASPFDGMATMYTLMSVFHLAPWLKLISRRRRTQRS